MDKTLHWVEDGAHYLYDVLSGVKDSNTTTAQHEQVIQPTREWLERH